MQGEQPLGRHFLLPNLVLNKKAPKKQWKPIPILVLKRILHGPVKLTSWLD